MMYLFSAKVYNFVRASPYNWNHLKKSRQIRRLRQNPPLYCQDYNEKDIAHGNLAGSVTVGGGGVCTGDFFRVYTPGFPSKSGIGNGNTFC